MKFLILHYLDQHDRIWWMKVPTRVLYFFRVDVTDYFCIFHHRWSRRIDSSTVYLKVMGSAPKYIPKNRTIINCVSKFIDLNIKIKNVYFIDWRLKQNIFLKINKLWIINFETLSNLIKSMSSFFVFLLYMISEVNYMNKFITFSRHMQFISYGNTINEFYKTIIYVTYKRNVSYLIRFILKL